MNFEDFLRAQDSRDVWSPEGRSKHKLLSDLNEAVEKLPKVGINESPFEVGDIVTPIKGGNRKGHGLPFQIVETFPTQRVIPLDGSPTRYYDCLAVVNLDGNPKVFHFYHTELEYFES